MYMLREKFIRFAVFAMAGIWLVTTATASLAQERGGSLILLVHPEPTTLASYSHSGATTTIAATKVYDGLLEYDRELRPMPSLATEWSTSDDGLSMTFKLKKGVKWHDGKPFTSADVQYSIMEGVRKLHPRGATVFAVVDSIETPDQYTAVFKLSKPAPALIQTFASDETPMIPRHLFEGTDVATNPLNNAPVGTGPFMFKEWVKGSHIVFERNPNYWRDGFPYLDNVVLRFIADAGTRVLALEKGEVHASINDAVPNEEVRRLDGLDHLEVVRKGHVAYGPILLLEINNRRPPLDQINVRKALAHAIDRQFVIDKIWFGDGVIATGPIPETQAAFYTDDVYKYDFNPEKARNLLDEAGLKPDANGVRFEITHDMLPFGGAWQRLGEYLKEALGDVGIKVTLRQQDFPTFLRRVYTDNDFDLTSTWFISLADPTMGVQRIYWGKNIKKGVGFSNGSGYSNPIVDDLWERAAVETNPATRADLYKELQRIIVDEIPVVWMMERRLAIVKNTRVHDLITTAQGLRDGLYRTWMLKE